MLDLIGVANEPSTWRGIIRILAAVGLVISPEYQEHIIAIALGVSGILGVFLKDKIH